MTASPLNPRRLATAALTLAGAAGAAAQTAPQQRLGRFAGEVGSLAAPAAVAVGDDGIVRVAEADADRIGAFPLQGNGPATVIAENLVAPHGVAVGDGGLLFVADTGRHRVAVLDETGRTQRSWGGFGTAPGRFNRPGAIAVRGERVYVADTGNDRIQVFDAGGRLVEVFGGRGREPGRFMRPVSLAVDPQGSVFVADADNQRVQKLDASGGVLNSWGGWGSFPGLFTDPSAVAWRDGVLYVADRLNHRVQAFDGEGRFLYQWGLHAVVPREGGGKIHYPNALALGPEGRTLVVAEAFENRCQLFVASTPEDGRGTPLQRPRRGIQSHFGGVLSVDGDLLAMWEPETRAVMIFHLGAETPILITKFGEFGSRFGQFGRITGLHIDATSKMLYVADAGNDRLQSFRLAIGDDWRLRYDPYLSRFVQGVGLGRLGRLLAPDDDTARLEPVAMAADAGGNLYALDRHRGRVVVLAPDWTVLRSWGGYGEGDGRFGNPVDLKLGPEGRVYVADAWARNVQVFEADGGHLRTLTGDDATPLRRPSAIAPAAGGFLYVTDAAADRVFKLDAAGRVVAAWGGPGTEHGRMWKPQGVALDARGLVYVLDFGNHRGQIFTPEGEWLVTFGAGRSYTKSRMSR